MGPQTVQSRGERRDDGDEVVGEFRLWRILRLRVEDFQGRPIGGEHLPDEVYTKPGKPVLVGDDDTRSPAFLHRLENGKESGAVELETRTDVGVEFRSRVDAEKAFLLPFEVVFLTVRGDSRVEDRNTMIALTHKAVDFRFQEPSSTTRCPDGVKPSIPVHPLKRFDVETELPCSFGWTQEQFVHDRGIICSHIRLGPIIC